MRIDAVDCACALGNSLSSSSGYGFLEKTKDGQDVRASFSYPMFQQFLADNQTLSELFAGAPFGYG